MTDTAAELRSFWAVDWEGSPYAPGTTICAAELPNEAYHRAPGVSKSGLDRVRRSVRRLLEPDEERTPALGVGAGVNDALLHPHRFAELYVKGPEDRRGNRWKDAVAAAEAAGVTLLVEGDYNLCIRIRDALLLHPEVSRLLGDGAVAEDSYFWTDEETGLLCRCRPDLTLASRALLDVKTAEDASAEAFRRAVFRFRYHVQDAFYCEGMRRACGECQGLVFVVVDKDDPHPENVALYQLDDALHDEGFFAFREDLGRLRDFLEREQREPGQWRGYPREIQTIHLHRSEGRSPHA